MLFGRGSRPLLDREEALRRMYPPPKPSDDVYRRVFQKRATKAELKRVKKYNAWRRDVNTVRRLRARRQARYLITIMPNFYELQSAHSEVWTIGKAEAGYAPEKGLPDWMYDHSGGWIVAYGHGGTDRDYLSPRSGKLVKGVMTGKHGNWFPTMEAAVRAIMRFENDPTPVSHGPWFIGLPGGVGGLRGR